MLPPCGDKITYEILMNSPPTLFFSPLISSPPFIFILRELFVRSPDYYIQMIIDVKPKIIESSPVDTG
jgi:hypothetical protein